LRIWSARAEALAKGSAFHLLRQLLHQAAQIATGDSLTVRQDKLVRTVAQSMTDADALRVAEFLGELCETPFASSDARIQLRSARSNAVLMGDQMRSAWEEFLAATSAQAPVILVLDDLHWGDLPTIRLMDAALRKIEGGRCMLLGIARPSVHQVFPALWQEHQCSVLALAGLDDDACRELSKGILGHEAKEEDLRRMIRLSGGNAFYLEELTRAFQASEGQQVPGTVLALAQARLRTLAPLPRQILRAGSIFSGSFALPGLRHLLASEEHALTIETALQTLVDNEFLTVSLGEADSNVPASKQFEFRNELMREAAYSTLTDTDRELGHRLAARWLHESGVRDALLLAKHFELGRENERATEWYALASAQALEGDDLAAAIALGERGISIGAKGRVVGLLHSSIARALLWTGENGSSSEHSSMALESLRVGSQDWAKAAGDGVTALGRCGAFGDIVDLGAELVKASKEGGMSGAIASALARSSSRLFLAGRYKDAEELYRELPTDIENLETTDPMVEGHILSAHANRCLCEGDPGRYLALCKESAAAFDACGDRRSATITRVNVGFAYAELGDYHSAETILRAALAVAIEMGLDAIGSLSRNNLGRVLLALDKLDEAWDLELVAIESFTMQGDDRMANGSRVYLSKIHQRKGALESARKEALEALQGTSTVETVRMQARAQLASVLLQMGKPNEALEEAKEAMRILETLGQVEEGESFVHLMLVECEIQCMHLDKAQDALKVAGASLYRRAEQIDDPNWRTSFLENVYDNVRIVQFLGEWGLADSGR